MKSCHACGTVWTEMHEPGRNEACLRCGADMHCCLNCRFHDVTRSGKCGSRSSEPPSDKTGGNACEEFMMADRKSAPPSPDERKKALDEKWKSLFKN